jgi:hypothetical protein
VEAYPVRAKNQYRVWFRDGSILVLTLVGTEQAPQFSIVKYSFGAPDITDSPNVRWADVGRGAWPRALCSEVDANGKERVLFSCDEDTISSYSPSIGVVPDGSIDPLVSGIYLADGCWGFSYYKYTDMYTGVLVPYCYAKTTHHFFDSPFQTHTIRSVRVEGQSRNAAHISVSLSKNYDTTQQTTSQLINIANPLATGLPEQYSAYSELANVQETDRNVCIKMTHNGSVAGNPDTVLEPPHYLQLLLVRSEEGGRDDA